jgi:hypothetical protein
LTTGWRKICTTIIGRFFTKKPRLISVEVRSEYLVFKKFLKHTGNGYIHVVEAGRNPGKKTQGITGRYLISLT